MFRFGRYNIGRDQPVFFIAEIGLNHDGKLEQALKLIRAAAQSGAQAAKFQMIIPERLFSSYEEHGFSGKNLVDFFRRYSFADDWLPRLKTCCENEGVEFLVTPFYEEAVDVLECTGVGAYKIASFELWHGPLLAKVKATGKPVFLSTGMSNDEDIASACSLFGEYPLALLHCSSLYPPQPGEVNLLAISALLRSYPCPVGFSDHFPGWNSVVAAVALGARVVEKHFTMDRSIKGADHAISLEPALFRTMVEQVREVEMMLGSGVKQRTGREEASFRYGRRSVFITSHVPAGSPVTDAAVDFLRPGVGMSPMDWPAAKGRIALFDLEPGHPLVSDDLAPLK
ncbi:MAG: N-acetylneuraminate synthase family protein [Candidatus Wallbacteria bacterium]|nr:N-acetylneuraminate synthase family protein [Candidatus Wallbacteria bacterium]